MSLSQEEADRMCAEIQAQVVDPNLPKKGQLCEFWDDNYENRCIQRFDRKEDDMFIDKDGFSRFNCKIIQTPATPIPWGGGKCPVDPETFVFIEYEKGDIIFGPARNMYWSEPLTYWVLER